MALELWVAGYTMYGKSGFRIVIIIQPYGVYLPLVLPRHRIPPTNPPPKAQ